MADVVALGEAMGEGALRLEPLAAYDAEPLRAACARDPEIWDIYPVSWFGSDFDASFASLRRAQDIGSRIPFAVTDAGRVVGMTSYINADRVHHTVEIGGTYIEPSVRGTGLNTVMKRLMIDRAFAAGFTRIEWRIDTRNARSMAAVAKLGATHEGTLRRHRITWTGHVRDTAVFGLLAGEWATR